MDLGFVVFFVQVGVQDVVKGYLVKDLSWKMFQIALLYRLLFVKLAFNPTHIANANKNIYTIFWKETINTFYGHFTLECVILSNCLLRLLIVCILCGWDNNDGLDIF